MIKRDARHTHEIKCRIAMAKVGFIKKKKKKKNKKKKKRKRKRKRKRKKKIKRKKKKRKKKKEEEEALFTSKLDLNLRKRQVKCNIWSTVLYGIEITTLRKVNQKYL